MRRTRCLIGNMRPICLHAQGPVALHQSGKLAEAESAYLHILEAKPDHGQAQRLLGVLRHQQGRHAEALDLIDGALNANRG